MSELVSLIKKAALDAYLEQSPLEIVVGTVLSEDPLKIKVSEKVVVEKDRLYLTKNVTDHKIMANVNHYTDMASCGDGSHRHTYSGTKEFLVKNALKKDDEVLMLKCFGGQKFIVMEKVGGDENGA